MPDYLCVYVGRDLLGDSHQMLSEAELTRQLRDELELEVEVHWDEGDGVAVDPGMTNVSGGRAVVMSEDVQHFLPRVRQVVASGDWRRRS
jgi:hypothetical protein